MGCIYLWENLPRATDQTDSWKVVPRQVFTPYSSLLISVAFVVLYRVWSSLETGVFSNKGTQHQKPTRFMPISRITK